MAYGSKNNNNKTSEEFDKHLKLENKLDSHKKPIKIGDDVTGLQLADKDVKVENDLTVGKDVSIGKDLTVNGDTISTAGNITLDSGGDIELDPASGDIKITSGTLKLSEQADANADNSGYGQIWVDTATPNELAFTDDAGTDIIGIGKYHYETKVANFYTNSGTANYLPLAGYIVESTSSLGRNEYQSMIAPYNGVIQKAMFRSESDMDGNIDFDIYEAIDETEIPGNNVGNKRVVVDRINDDISVEFDFADSMNSGSNVLTKGRLYMIKLTTPSAPNDTNVTLVFKWDITS